MDTNRLFSVSAEAALLGSIIVNPDCLLGVMDVLSGPEMFFMEEHKKIYTCLLGMFIQQQPIDGVLVRDALDNRGWLEEVGGVDYLQRILESVPSSASAMYYADIVQKRHQYRHLITMSDKIQHILQEYDEVAVMTDKIKTLVLAQSIAERQEYAEINGLEAALEMVDKPPSAISTEFRDLDRRVSFTAGDVVIIAGRPSMGKSALAVNIVQNMAKAGHGALIVSLEMMPVAITKRMIAREARINTRYIQDKDAVKIAEAAELVRQLPIMIAQHTTTVAQIMAVVAQIKASKGIDVVVLDYIQLLGVDKITSNRNQELSTISRTLKLIAMRQNVLVIVVSQLNRQVENRTDRRPRMSDLRDSGAIEQDADWVLLLYRADYYRKPGEKTDGLAEVRVAKARDGETGICEMLFTPEYTSFDNLHRDDPEFP